MAERACMNCEFWEEDEAQKLGLGECRRYPPPGYNTLDLALAEYVSEIGSQLCPDEPSEELTMGGQEGGWFKHHYMSPAASHGPIMSCEDWCGEFKARDLPNPPIGAEERG